jgi:FkbM family methyltransferase
MSPLTRRMKILQGKLSGSLPILTWPEVLRSVLQKSHPGGLDPILSELLRVKRYESSDSVLWETPAGPMWARVSDAAWLSAYLSEQRAERVYEHGPVAVRPGDVVIDGGAHIGAWTRLALNQGAAQVIAFEPQAENAQLLRRNVASEIISSKAILFEAALWAEPGELTLHLHPQESAGHTVLPLSRAWETERVRAVTIDESVDRLRLNRVDLIQLDVEGAEEQALAGARETLARFAPRLAVAAYHRNLIPEAICRVVRQARPDYQVVSTSRRLFFYR